jgi:mannose-1-phosphate guanylyltransferase/phosphomannomutase
MAGGQGSRLRPLTCDLPKPMVPVCNRPIMEYAVDLLKNHGINDIGVTLQYLPQKIIDHFGNGGSFNVKINYFIEEIPLGTAGSVKNASDFLDETFVVVSGDALTDFNLNPAIEFHKAGGALATLVLTEVSNPLEYGVVITDNDGNIKRFVEKPGWGEVFSDWVNTGIYILEPEILDYFDFEVKFDFSKDLFPLLMKNNKKILGCLLSGYWCDVGNIDQYIQAHKDILEGKVNVKPKGTLINDKNSGSVLLGENCIINEDVLLGSDTVIGNNVVLDKEVSIKKSIIWNNTYVGKNSAIRGGVIGQGVIIKPNVNIFEGAAVGDNTIINELSMVKPNVKIWPNKIIDTGVIVKESLVWGTKQKKELFGTEGVPGLINWDITPEMGAKLGVAFGSIIETNDMVTVSSDDQPVTKMIKNALISGLISAGINVKDLGNITTPAHRLSAHKMNSKGGIHVKRDYKDSEKCWVQFFDEKGVNIERNVERKIENMYCREEFRRVKPENVGKVLEEKHFLQTYLDYILKDTDVEIIRKLDTNIVVNAKGAAVNKLISTVAERLNLGIINFIERKNYDISNQIIELVKKYKAQMGVIFDDNGENLTLIDNKGNIINQHTFIALIVLILMKINKGRTVVVPITASEVVEKVAEKFGGKVIRTKTAPWAIMKAALVNEKNYNDYSQFFFQNDSLYAVIKIFEFLAKYNTTLSDLITEIPEIFIKVKTTDCPWEQKGRVMRAIIEEENNNDIELIDGVKIRNKNGWTLVLPHADEPLYNIYSEGKDYETAEELVNIYRDKINKILHS